MELVKASIDHTQKHVTGAVELQLYKGNVTVVGRESPFSLYRWGGARHAACMHTCSCLLVVTQKPTFEEDLCGLWHQLTLLSSLCLCSADLASMEIEGGGLDVDYNPIDAQVCA
jgi:hypothetical protein